MLCFYSQFSEIMLFRWAELCSHVANVAFAAEIARYKTRQAEGWKLDAVLLSRREIHKKISSSEILCCFYALAVPNRHDSSHKLSLQPCNIIFCFASSPHPKFFHDCISIHHKFDFFLLFCKKRLLFPFLRVLFNLTEQEFALLMVFRTAVCVFVRDYRGKVCWWCQQTKAIFGLSRYVWFTGPRNEVAPGNLISWWFIFGKNSHFPIKFMLFFAALGCHPMLYRS